MQKNEDNTSQLIRAALYIRVSGEEQKIKGLSLEAQQERLEAYAKERGWLIAGIYIDAAKTARKNMHKRAEFQRMMETVKRDEIDVLLFCRLDRWFRSVADYYKVMEVLEAHNCNWVTSDEEYNTSTANGRLYINVKLSIAQNEADIDGERIDVVFDSKIAHGTVLSGKCPFGYTTNSEKRLEINQEQADIVQDAFSHFESAISQRGTIKYIREKYGVNWCDATFRRMLHEKLYTGVYDRGGRYNGNFCPPISSSEQFYHVQELTKKNARSAPSGRIFIFTSSSTDKAAIKHKPQKLKELYVNDLIDIEEYKKDYQIYTTALNQLPEPTEEKPPDFPKVEAIKNDFKQIYGTLTREEKRTLWRSAIKEGILTHRHHFSTIEINFSI